MTTKITRPLGPVLICATPEYTPLDEVYHEILQLLQRVARNLTAVDIADQTGVFDGTVRNRIKNMEKQNIFKSYTPTINYEIAGYQLEVRIMYSSRIVKHSQSAKEPDARLAATDFHNYNAVTTADGAPPADGGQMAASDPGLGIVPREDVLGDSVAIYD